MKKILVLLCVIALFLACDYATDSTSLDPDVEIVHMNPIGWYTSSSDSTASASIDTVLFVAENSVDCYLSELSWTYQDENGSTFYGPEHISLYVKVNGKAGTEVDTAKLLNIQIPLSPVWQNVPSGEQCRVILEFIFVDEYWGSRYDTATAWYGIYMWPE